MSSKTPRPPRTSASVPCGAHSRAYRGDCILPVGHGGKCFTGAAFFVAQATTTTADDGGDEGEASVSTGGER